METAEGGILQDAAEDATEDGTVLLEKQMQRFLTIVLSLGQKP
jgi:hypothetical protein